MSSLDGPIPIGATYGLLLNKLTVTFDQPLQPGPKNGAAWSARVANLVRNGVTAMVTGSQIVVDCAVGDPAIGPNVCHYVPPPISVRSIGGVPADAFVDFPIT